MEPPHPYTRIGIFHLHPAHVILILAVLGLSQDYLIPWQTLCQSIPEWRSYIGSPGIVQRLPTPCDPVSEYPRTPELQRAVPGLSGDYHPPCPVSETLELHWQSWGTIFLTLWDSVSELPSCTCTLTLIFCLILLLYPTCITSLCLTFEMEVGYSGMAICAWALYLLDLDLAIMFYPALDSQTDAFVSSNCIAL